MTTRPRGMVLGFLFVIAWMAPTAHSRAQQYQFTLLYPPGEEGDTFVAGISGSNIVGNCEDDTSFYYDGSSYSSVSFPGSPGAGTYVTGVSGSDVVGSYYIGDGLSGAFIYSGSAYTTIDQYPNADYTTPTGISGNIIIGIASNNFYDDPYFSTNFLYNTETRAFSTLDNPLGSNTIPMGIDGNNIVGTYSGVNGFTQSFLYNGSTYTTLYDPLATGQQDWGGPGPSGTFATGISGNKVVGYYIDANGDDESFTYNIDDDTYTTLDYPSGMETQLIGISGCNIVGQVAYEENFNGSSAFIATPVPEAGSPVVPEPSSWANLTLSLIGLLVLSRPSLGSCFLTLPCRERFAHVPENEESPGAPLSRRR